MSSEPFVFFPSVSWHVFESPGSTEYLIPLTVKSCASAESDSDAAARSVRVNLCFIFGDL